MSLPPLPPPDRSLAILKTGLYLLSGLILVMGLWTGISLMASASTAAANALLPLQLVGGGALSNLVAPMLTGFLINLGVAVILIALVLSAMLYAIGRLSGRSAMLEARLSRLEAREN